MTRLELIAACRTRGLPITGNRPQLVERLVNSDETQPPALSVDSLADESGASITLVDVDEDGDRVDRSAQPVAQPAEEVALPDAEPIDEVAMLRSLVASLHSKVEALQTVAAASPAKPAAVAVSAAEPADPQQIAAQRRREQTFTTTFVMGLGVELGDGLHQSYQAQTLAQASAAGLRPRGPAHRVGPIVDGVVTYEVYVRKA